MFVSARDMFDVGMLSASINRSTISGHSRAACHTITFQFNPSRIALPRFGSCSEIFPTVTRPATLTKSSSEGSPWCAARSAWFVWPQVSENTLRLEAATLASCPPLASTSSAFFSSMLSPTSPGSRSTAAALRHSSKENPTCTSLRSLRWTSWATIPEAALFRGWTPTCVECRRETYCNSCVSRIRKASSRSMTSFASGRRARAMTLAIAGDAATIFVFMAYMRASSQAVRQHAHEQNTTACDRKYAKHVFFVCMWDLDWT